MRWLASRTSSARRDSGEPDSGRPRSKVSTAIREATSPAWAPPIPSATTNRGARTYALSSFSRRWRPVSVLHTVSVTPSTVSPSLQEGELGVADPDAVARMQRLRATERLAVQVGAVGRAEILDHHHVPLTGEAGVAGGGERVLELDLHIAPAQRGAAVGNVVDHPRLVPGRPLDQQPRLESVLAGKHRGRLEHAGPLRRRRRGARPGHAALPPTHVAQGAQRHPDQKQVEDGQEAELQGHRDGLEHRAAGYSSSNRRIVAPSSISSPGRTTSERSTTCPLIRDPFVEPRSVSTHEPPRGRSSACWRETLGSLSTMSHWRLRPIVTPPGPTTIRRPSSSSSAVCWRCWARSSSGSARRSALL